MTDTPEHMAPQRLDPASERRRHTRSLAIAAILVGLVVLFYVATIVRLGGNIANRMF